MKKLVGIAAVLLAVGLTLYTSQRPQQATPAPVPMAKVAAPARLATAYGRLPLHFEPNHGQADAPALFLARGPGYALSLTATEAVLALHKGADATRPAPATVLTMRLVGANAEPVVEGVDERPGKSHYFIGNDPEKWHTNIPHYGQVKYSEVYPGIDMVYYGNPQQLQFDLVVAPGADPDVIILAFEGQDDLQIDDQGTSCSPLAKAM